MMPERINEIASRIVEKLWPIKVNLDKKLTVDELKNKIYNEFVIPKKSQKWIVGRIFDDMDEVKLSQDTSYSNSIFLIVSESPVVAICDKIIEEDVNTKDTEQKDVGLVDKSLLTVNKINDIQKERENINCKEVELLNGDSQLIEDTSTELVPISTLQLEDKDENKLFNLYIQLSGEEPNIESSLVLFDRENVKQNELIDNTNKTEIIHVNLTSEQQDVDDNNKFVEPEKNVLTIVEIEQDKTIPGDSSYHKIENIDKEKESPVLESNQQEDIINSGDSSHHEVDNINEKKDLIISEEYTTTDSLSSHHDDINKTESFNLKNEHQDLDEEKKSDDTISIATSESLKTDNLKEIMKDLNDNYQLPPSVVIPNEKENGNYVKQLPLVIPDSSYIEPAYKKNPRLFRKPHESKLHSVNQREDDDNAVGFTDYSLDYETSLNEEVDDLRDYRANRHESWQNQRFNKDKITINKQTSTLIQDEEEDLQTAIQMSKQTYEKNNVTNDRNYNTTLIQQKPKKETNKNTENSSLIELIMLEDVDLIKNFNDFQCPICLEIFGEYEGVILRDCHHTFCRDCLRNTIRHCEEPVVKCPYTEEYTCESVLRDLEIKSLVDASVYEKHILKSLVYAENTASKNTTEKSFHCLSPDCPGWCYYQGFELVFDCYVCRRRNCLVCRVIHPLNEECWDHYDKATNSQTLKLTEAQRLSMIKKREIMECSNCKVAIVKNEGCDGIECTMCKTMLCWPTRGPRWGPGGKGDTSGGCRCGLPPGRTCHPECRGCH